MFCAKTWTRGRERVAKRVAPDHEPLAEAVQASHLDVVRASVSIIPARTMRMEAAQRDAEQGEHRQDELLGLGEGAVARRDQRHGRQHVEPGEESQDEQRADDELRAARSRRASSAEIAWSSGRPARSAATTPRKSEIGTIISAVIAARIERVAGAVP